MKKSTRVAALMALSTLLTSAALGQGSSQPAVDPAKATPAVPAQPAATPGKPLEVKPGEVKPVTGRPQPGGEAPKVSPEVRGQMADKALELAMKKLGSGLKSLKETVGSAEKKDESLKTLNEMERAAMGVKSLEPTELKGDDHAKAVLEFKKHQIKLVEHLLLLESQILDDKHEQAKETLNKIEAFRNEAHKLLKKPEPEKAPTK